MVRLLCDSDDIACIRKALDNFDALVNSTGSEAFDYSRMVSKVSVSVSVSVVTSLHRECRALVGC